MNSRQQPNMVSPGVCAFSSFSICNNHCFPSGFVSTAPTFVPVFVERGQPPRTAINLTPPTYPWSQPISTSPWPFTEPTTTTENVPNSYPTDIYTNDYHHQQQQHQPPPQQQPTEWYDYEASSNSYEFYDTENIDLDIPLDRDEGRQESVAPTDWDSLQEWAFELTTDDENDRDYPSKRLQRMACEMLRSDRVQSAVIPSREFTTGIADTEVWKKLREKETEVNRREMMWDEPTSDLQTNEQQKKDLELEENGIEVIIPDTLPPIPCCETLLLPPDISDSNANVPPAPVSYAAASTPRNTAETISSYMNRMVKMHIAAANTPLTEPFPMRHRNPKSVAGSQQKPPPVYLGPKCDPNESNSTMTTSEPIVQGLDAMAALARRSLFTLRQLNGGLLLIPFSQDEHRYCIGSSPAGRMLVGLEKLSPPRLYANDFRTICLKKVPYTEDCDKVWCRLNLFRKQIGAEKSAARRNNVAIYELFARSEQFAYFGRLPYKWNLDEYLKSDHYNATITNNEKEGLRILRGITNGLAYVHRGDFRLFHGNLKPSNVLISSDGSVFLTDYGFGRICCPMWSGAAAHRSCRDMDSGTFDPLCWKAYEFFSGCSSFAMTMQNTHTSPTQSRETPHRQADVFSAALLGYYAITSGHSHPLINGDEAYRKTLHFYRQRIDRFADFVQLDQVAGPTARRLIFSMLEVDVKHRPDARYVADHPAFWNDKKRNDFLIAVAEYVCANEKLMPQSILCSHVQSATLLRVLTTKKVASLNFAQRLNSTPENVAKIAARFGVKFEDASEAVALKTFYRQHRRQTNGTDKTMLSEEMEPLWDELAADIYDIVYPSPPLKLKPFFTK